MTAATIRRFRIPSPDELFDRARAMAPEIRDLGEATERNRNVFPHITMYGQHAFGLEPRGEY